MVDRAELKLSSLFAFELTPERVEAIERAKETEPIWRRAEHPVPATRREVKHVLGEFLRGDPGGRAGLVRRCSCGAEVVNQATRLDSANRWMHDSAAHFGLIIEEPKF